MNAEQIVGALRRCPSCRQCVYGDTPLGCQSKMRNDAADLIESLQVQLAASQRRERAAVGDIKDAATTTEKVCKWCLHRGNRERCQSCGWATGWLIRDWKSDNWQWRGPMAGEGEAARV